jgi:Domain of unknown function (DUF5710)/Competence protein CoiA-like family
MIPLGAIIKGTDRYVYPRIANKQSQYECPDCHRDLILRQGKIRVHHFAHTKTEHPCHYYTKPTELQVHKDAKMLLKKLLEDCIQIVISRTCRCCGDQEEYEIPQLDNTSSIVLEYRFEYNGSIKIADVGYIDVCGDNTTNENPILAIFEICNTHKTESESRPEPWFEIDAWELINIANNTTVAGRFEDPIATDCTIKLPCIRSELCDKCIANNICTGNGDCMWLAGNGQWVKNRDWKCEYGCIALPLQSSSQELTNDFVETPYEDVNDRIYLEVPYSKKDEAKRLGAQFDFRFKKKWYIYEFSRNKDVLLSKYRRWL